MNVRPVSRETDRPRIGVVGTGTEVGKTHVAVALVAALAARGEQVAGLKPIESGVTDGVLTDGEQLARVSTVSIAPAPYLFADPVSPHLAARRTGRIIAVDAARLWVDAQPYEIGVIESAGALLSPLGRGVTNADLLRAMAPSAVVLVGVDRLGVLHDVAACLLALRTFASNAPAPVVALNPPPVPDASTGTNGAELVSLGLVEHVVVFPRADSTDPGTLDAAAQTLRALGV